MLEIRSIQIHIIIRATFNQSIRTYSRSHTQTHCSNRIERARERAHTGERNRIVIISKCPVGKRIFVVVLLLLLLQPLVSIRLDSEWIRQLAQDHGTITS